MATEKTTPTETVSKSDRFKNLANKRTENALNAIAKIGGLAAPANYEYTEDQVSKIIGALTTEIEIVKTRFANPKAKVTTGFSL